MTDIYILNKDLSVPNEIVLRKNKNFTNCKSYKTMEILF